VRWVCTPVVARFYWDWVDLRPVLAEEAREEGAEVQIVVVPVQG
jgi:hypothetical protein